MRTDITFHSGDDWCAGWLYRPEGFEGPRPLMVMAHGFSATKELRLPAYAERFCAAGIGVLLFDYRHFGASDGEPRQLMSIGRQLEDWASAIAHARGLPGVDPAKIALWGSSFSGGHVIVAAARDGKVAAVSSQGPMMDGLAAALNIVRYAGIGTMLRFTGAGLLDQVRALLGLSPVYVPLIAPPGQFAAMSSHDSDSGYRTITPPGWRNQMTARVALQLATYRPIADAGRLPCPTLILVCTKDSVAPPGAAVATARKAGSRAELKEYDIGHFEIYTGAGFERSSSDQLAFFNRVLLNRS